MNERNWEATIARHLDGIATVGEVADLSAAIESDASVRTLYLSMARVHAGLATSPPSEKRILSLKEDRSFLNGAWMKVAALFVIGLTVAAAFWFGGKQGAVVVEVNGSVQWTQNDGRSHFIGESGMNISAGTLESLTPDSLVALRFADGTTVTLSGQSSLMFSENDGKQLHFREGMLFADVAPQVETKPLTLSTATAEMTVVGTRFEVMADETRTQLTVNEGRVMLRRIADGSRVEISAGYRAVATFATEEALRMTEIPITTRSYQFHLERDVDHGKWVPSAVAVRWELSQEIEAGRLAEQDFQRAYVNRLSSLPEDTGYVFAQPMRSRDEVFYVASLSAKADPAGSVLLDENARFLVQGSVRSPTEIVIGVGASDAKRSNPGRFMTRRRVEGDFKLEIPVDALRAENRRAVGLYLLCWFCFTTEREPGLAITSVELVNN